MSLDNLHHLCTEGDLKGISPTRHILYLDTLTLPSLLLPTQRMPMLQSDNKFVNILLKNYNLINCISIIIYSGSTLVGCGKIFKKLFSSLLFFQDNDYRLVLFFFRGKWRDLRRQTGSKVAHKCHTKFKGLNHFFSKWHTQRVS